MLINFYNCLKKQYNHFVEILGTKITKSVFEKYKNMLNNNKKDCNAYFVVKNCSFNSALTVYKNNEIKAYFSKESAVSFNKNKQTNIRLFHEMMNSVNFSVSQKNYKEILPTNSFVFLDPPYIVKDVICYYKNFKIDLNDIYNYFIRLHDRKNKIMLFLNDSPEILHKFKDFNINFYKKKHVIPFIQEFFYKKSL